MIQIAADAALKQELQCWLLKVRAACATGQMSVLYYIMTLCMKWDISKSEVFTYGLVLLYAIR